MKTELMYFKNEDVKVLLFEDDMILYAKDAKHFTRKLFKVKTLSSV